MKKLLICIYSCLISTCMYAQELTFPHCNCKEIRTENFYKVISNDVTVDEGTFTDGKRNGTWISRDVESNVIRKANYKNGELENSYELFYKNGRPKVKGMFANGRPDGEWTYYHQNGKISKSGGYKNGVPVGTWKIYTKKGTQILSEYDFDTKKELISSNGKQYFANGGLIRDEQSGEWMFIYHPFRQIKVSQQPVGGYLVANDLFIKNFNLPTLLMNTINTLEYSAKIKFVDGAVDSIVIAPLDKGYRFDINSHSFAFAVSTNKKSKLHQVKPSAATLDFLMGQIKEHIILSGPWTNVQNDEITIQIPLIINDLKK